MGHKRSSTAYVRRLVMVSYFRYLGRTITINDWPLVVGNFRNA